MKSHKSHPGFLNPLVPAGRNLGQTSEPNVEVSWQVTGIRQDPFANQNRIPEAVEKSPEERGYYQHPAAYGQPAERGIGSLEKEKREATKVKQ